VTLFCFWAPCTNILTYLLTGTSCKFYNNPFTVGSKILAVEWFFVHTCHRCGRKSNRFFSFVRRNRFVSVVYVCSRSVHERVTLINIDIAWFDWDCRQSAGRRRLRMVSRNRSTRLSESATLTSGIGKYYYTFPQSAAAARATPRAVKWITYIQCIGGPPIIYWGRTSEKIRGKPSSSSFL